MRAEEEMDTARFRVDSYPVLMMVLHVEHGVGSGAAAEITPEDIDAAVQQTSPGAVWALPVGHRIDSYRIAVLYCEHVRYDHRAEVHDKLAAINATRHYQAIEVITPIDTPEEAT